MNGDDLMEHQSLNSAESEDPPLEFKLHLNVLHHLGVQLYATAPSVITELVANAWDADSTSVSVLIDPANGTLSVLDNGHGMARSDLQARFLSVGYNRRDFDGSAFSRSGNRRVMGRKGIGKLAMFSIARDIEVHTQSLNEKPVRFKIDVDALAQSAKADSTYYPQEDKTPDPLPGGHGTIIKLGRLNRSVNGSQGYLVPRLARRFGIIGPAYNFKLTVNDHEVSRRDAGIYDHLQFFWYFDPSSKEVALKMAPTIACLESLSGEKAIGSLENLVDVDGRYLQVRGFIATVDQPGRLGAKDESINQISLFANGRLWQEDLLSQVGDTRYFNSYIVGEIHADFLDEDGVDRATSARESVIQHDPYVSAIRNLLIRSLAVVRDQWDIWRNEVAPDENNEANAIMAEWIDSLMNDRDKQLARKLINSIDKISIYNDDVKNANARKMLFRSTMIAFEKLRVKSSLDRLENIDDVLSPDFQQIFATLDDLEETYFHDISKQRLEVIEKFDISLSDKVLEKVIQKYLMDHLWLLDPTWDRIQGTQQEEITLSKYLRDKFPDEKQGARIDIAYRCQSGRHVIIELKRPGKAVPFLKIMDQCNKYRKAVLAYTRQHGAWFDGGGAPSAVATYFILSDKGHLDDSEESALMDIGVKVVTYNTLIATARATYSAYYDGRREVRTRVESFLARLA